MLTKKVPIANLSYLSQVISAVLKFRVKTIVPTP